MDLAIKTFWQKKLTLGPEEGLGSDKEFFLASFLLVAFTIKQQVKKIVTNF